VIKTVTILDVEDRATTVFGVVVSVNGVIQYDGLSKKFIDELKEGIVGRNGKRFTPDDGDAFLEELQYQFSGSRIRATAPKERQ